MQNKAAYEMKGFSLGSPKLVCRWRLAGGTLPMAGRHMRALSQRTIDGKALTPELVAWVKQHVEWALKDGAAANPNGVLMLVVDEKGQAAMTVGPFESLRATTSTALIHRAQESAIEAHITGVAPETIWAFVDSKLLCGMPADTKSAAATSLISDLASTIGMVVVREPLLITSLQEGLYKNAELFLVSDEHGVVLAQDQAGNHARRLAEGYDKLLKAQKK